MFTQAKRRRSYTDILCIGIKTESAKYQYAENSYHENIHGFTIQHFRIKDKALHAIETPITFDCIDILECISSYFKTGNNVLIVCNNSLVCFGSSDFTDKLDMGEIVLCESKHNANDYLLEDEIELSSECFVASIPPAIAIINMVKNNVTYTIIDVCNYGIKKLDDVFCKLSYSEQALIPNVTDQGIDCNDSLIACVLIGRFMQEYVKVVCRNSLGGIALTYASQGMQGFRTGFYQNNILQTDDNSSIILERNCYLGGRLETRYTGRYNGYCYLLDIQSCYPFLGTQKQFPYKISDRKFSDAGITIQDRTDYLNCMARVSIKTDEPAYPCYQKGRLIFPIGYFETWLCGEELEYAVSRGHVKRIYELQEYNMDFILRDYSKHLLDIRSKYKRSGNKLAEQITKYITNGTWGQFGKQSHLWQVVPDEIADRRYGGYYRIDRKTKEVHQWRIIDGVCSKLISCRKSPNTYPPVSVFMNSYARHYLYQIMRQAGFENVLYSCIDGLIVTAEGYVRLLNYITDDPHEYGKLKVSEKGEHCDIIGNGIYKIGNKVAAMGISREENKRIQGFWSVLKDNDTLVDKRVKSGESVIVRYMNTPDYNTILNMVPESGRFNDPIVLVDMPDSQHHQSFGMDNLPMHFPEWSV